MATWAIGDIQGCDQTLERLLLRLAFDPARDRLWFVGDLVNRGPRSLEVLRRVRALGARAEVVLGNHDLHLLGRAHGTRRAHPADTLDGVLAAPDRGELLGWLAARPFLVREGAHTLVHAGLLPAWTLAEAEALARDAAGALRRDPAGFLAGLERAEPDPLCDAARVLTRVRCVDEAGRADFEFKGPPADAPPGLRPWFARPRASAGGTLVFGHWAALGLHLEAGVVALDSGCVWGNCLSAYRLEDARVVSEPCADDVSPGRGEG